MRRRAEEDAQLKQQLLTQSLDEKIRLGRDLHDGIIQSLYAVGLTLETVRALVKSNPAEADRQLEHTRAGLNETIRDVRAYITGLAPENLRRGGVANALSALLAELKAGRSAQFDITIDGDAASLLQSGATALGGRVPVNPSGGLIAKGHPPGATGDHASDQRTAPSR